MRATGFAIVLVSFAGVAASCSSSISKATPAAEQTTLALTSSANTTGPVPTTSGAAAALTSIAATVPSATTGPPEATDTAAAPPVASTAAFETAEATAAAPTGTDVASIATAAHAKLATITAGDITKNLASCPAAAAAASLIKITGNGLTGKPGIEHGSLYCVAAGKDDNGNSLATLHVQNDDGEDPTDDHIVQEQQRATRHGYQVVRFDSAAGPVYIEDLRSVSATTTVNQRNVALWEQDNMFIQYEYSSVPLDPGVVGPAFAAAIPSILASIAALPDNPS